MHTPPWAAAADDTNLVNGLISPTYEQTVPRDLVHRWSLSEVFLTSYQGVDERRFTCAAQLPLTHAYFRDHPLDRDVHDPLNVLESCRQAVTCAAHLHQAVPRSTTFMVGSWSMEITDPAALTSDERPGELRIDGTVLDRYERGGHIRRLVFAMKMAIDGRALGELSMDVNATPTDQYHMLRRRQRGSAAPTAFTLPADPDGRPVLPAEVGRLDPRNVVLDQACRSAEALTAVLSPRTFRNRSMYDHPYDHVPAMVLSEAARQCALLLAPTGPSRGRRVLRLDGRFTTFAELDSPVKLTARAASETGDVRMTAKQGEVSVAEIDLDLS